MIFLGLCKFITRDILIKIKITSMSTLVSRISPITGKIEWLMQDDNYDFQQEIARLGDK